MRTPILTRDQVPEELREAFDHETANSGGVVDSGPGSAMINSPEMRRRSNYLVNYLRDESSLPKQVQELVMILTARNMDCQYIWHAHAARARLQGISDEFVDNLRDGKPLPQLSDDLQIVVNYVNELFDNHRVERWDLPSCHQPLRRVEPHRDYHSDGVLLPARLQRQLL